MRARIRSRRGTLSRPQFDNAPYHQTPGFLIRRLHQIHVAIFLEECAAFNITPVQFSLLKALSAGAEMDQATIATQIGVDRTTTAGVLRRLHARGLVRWRNAPHDLRAKFWRRTPAGDRLVKKMAAHASRSHERLVASLTQSQQGRTSVFFGDWSMPTTSLDEPRCNSSSLRGRRAC